MRSAESLMPLVYDELRGLAQSYLNRERPEHTLQATALVNEAYLRLAGQKRVEWQGRQHFFALGAKVMRRILVDHAREKQSLKRGGDHLKVSLDPSAGRREHLDFGIEELLSLNDTLERLALFDERGAKVVELRYFAGLTVEEVSQVLGVSRRTVEGDWTHARSWLRIEMDEKSAK